MTGRVSALIPAAGAGERLGMGPKALLDLGGRTLLRRAIDALMPLADEVIVALPAERLDLPLPPGVRAVGGGATRQETVRRLLDAASGDLVVIHDAARPFLSGSVARAVLDAARAGGASTAALPVPDTLVLDEGGAWAGLLDRSHARAVQTPQAFRRALLLEAHEAAQREGVTATDDAGLVARLGHPVALVDGDPRLLKLTRPGDWALAVAFAPAWDREDG
ncbi:MAG TPA: 2-C-methyl-D-erythritol 4-phosphate cytidylyltransferase [Deinococcales bacterium]|nr:2-C-methyl-D-erythritol 4-phosphate cytidylyltransferase [Deinococcales bacterium]